MEQINITNNNNSLVGPFLRGKIRAFNVTLLNLSNR